MKKNCLECGRKFSVKRDTGRQPNFCSRKCYQTQYDRHPDDDRNTPKDAICGLEDCKTPFVKKKRNQRYCSRACYERAWLTINRDKFNALVRQRRINQPEWYAEREPIYAKRHRAKLLTSRPWAYLMKSRQQEAKNKDLPFDLTHEWACRRWNGSCEITGIVFRVNGKRGPHPFSPSLDRIDPEKGYVQSNCRFILWGCNAIKGVGTDADMYEIAAAITNARKDS